MRIEVANRGNDGIISFKAETAAEKLQLSWLLDKAKTLEFDAFSFTGWDDDDPGISFVTKLTEFVKVNRDAPTQTEQRHAT